MCAEIGVGAWVESIDTETVAPGTVAQVTSLGSADHHCNGCGWVKAETLNLSIDPPGGWGTRGWCPNHWRPIFNDPQAVTRSIRQMLDAPARTPELAPAGRNALARQP
jgi:hypothetical protein